LNHFFQRKEQSVFIMIDNDADILAKKELIEKRMNERKNKRVTENKNVKSDTSTEELVLLFNKDFEPEVEILENMMTAIESMNEADVGPELDKIVSHLQKLQESVNDAGIFLPAYDSKKCQHILNNLSSKYQDVKDKVKPKKKFGFKNRKQKTVVKVPDVSELSLTSSAGDNKKPSYNDDNSCNIRDISEQTLVMDRSDVQAKDVTVSGMNNSRLEIQGSPSTLHLANISNCTILCGPVSSSVMVDTCKDTCLVISCQQLRTHNTTNTDIYLHTTARAILEDCSGVRVAPYSWSYPGIDQDYKIAGLDRNVNNWEQIGDFNWLSVDKPSPNWSILQEDKRKQEF